MSVPAYPSYRESGAEWLGPLPTSWDVVPLKRAASLVTTKAVERTRPIALENIESRSGKLIVTEGDFSGDGTVFVAGDILYGKLRPYLAKVYEAKFSGEAVGDFHVLRPQPGMLPTYFAYLLLTDEATLILNGSTHGAKMPRVSWEFLGALKVPRPSISEQTAIAAFLDRETAKIDALVAEQRRLIELLKEKRQTVISHAVTKGLDPAAPMKHSGVEWLGDIPTHWQVKRLKHLSPAITVGIVVDPSTYTSDEGLPFLFGGDISPGVVHVAGARRISPERSASQPKTILRAGDLVTVRVGAPGITAVVPPDCEGGNCASVMLVRKGRHSSEWLCYVMNSDQMKFQVELVQYGAAQKQFNISHAVNFVIATPPALEAEQIAARLDAELANISALSVQAAEATALLNERRAALIFAAVTGKIDVRGAMAQQAEAA